MSGHPHDELGKTQKEFLQRGLHLRLRRIGPGTSVSQWSQGSERRECPDQLPARVEIIMLGESRVEPERL